MGVTLDVGAQKSFLALLSAIFSSVVPAPSMLHSRSIAGIGSLSKGMGQPGLNCRSNAATLVALLAPRFVLTASPPMEPTSMDMASGMAPAVVASTALRARSPLETARCLGFLPLGASLSVAICSSLWLRLGGSVGRRLDITANLQAFAYGVCTGTDAEQGQNIIGDFRKLTLTSNDDEEAERDDKSEDQQLESRHAGTTGEFLQHLA